MKKYLNILSAFIIGVSGVTFVATARGQLDSTRDAKVPKVISPEEAKAMRRDNAATIFTAGLFIAAFVSIPIVNLATPIFAMAFMVHMHKRLSGPRPELIEPARQMR